MLYISILKEYSKYFPSLPFLSFLILFISLSLFLSFNSSLFYVLYLFIYLFLLFSRERERVIDRAFFRAIRQLETHTSLSHTHKHSRTHTHTHTKRHTFVSHLFLSNLKWRTYIFQHHQMVDEEDKFALEKVPHAFATFGLGSGYFTTSKL